MHLVATFAANATLPFPMAETHFLPDEAGETKRPDLISALGLLTFINTGIFILVYGITQALGSTVGTIGKPHKISSPRNS